MIGKNAKFNQKAKKVEKLKPISTRRDVSQSLTPVLKKLPPVATAVDKKIKKTFFNPSKEEYRRLVVGNFQDEFSKQSSKLFRVFLSSTFSDFKVERNELYRRVFPPIRERCAKIGFEFQVVDMRWGVSDTADIDHTADLICMNEIEQSIEQSAGLNFIYLVGNRYGYLYVPLEIDKDEFETIMDVAEQEGIPNLELVEKWFLLDENRSPSKYLYVPITTYYKNFPEEGKKEWAQEEKLTIKALRDAVDKAMDKKKITYETGIKYFQSITEREIRRATLEKNRSNVVGVIRDFTNPKIENETDAKFFDSAKNPRIKSSIENLKSYCQQHTLEQHLKTFVVPWESGGLNIEKIGDHREYVDALCTFLIETISRLIEKKARDLANKSFSPLHEDILHHSLFCREKTKFFFGREELLESVHTRIEYQQKNVSTPLGVVAESGSGKTAFMARLAQKLREWYPNCAVVVRFLGTSAASSSLELVLRSIYLQLREIYHWDFIEIEESSLKMPTLIRIFQESLKSIGKHRLLKKQIPKPLFILLDAIDQLSDVQKSVFHFDNWLMRYLPRDVHIIASFMPVVERINLRDSFLHLLRSDETELFEVPRLRSQDCQDFIQSALQKHNRRLHPTQLSYLLSAVENNAKPLYLKLLIDIARNWNSFENSSLNPSLNLPETIEQTIEQLFIRLEKRHGQEFVQYSLAYLVYGLDGISENELEDCLSINDTVLNEIYAHHDPPIPNAIHVPSLLCQSFLFSINEYVTRKRTYDKHILSFYHRKFFEITRKRYAHLSGICHEHLLDLYSHGNSAFRRTIQLKKRRDKVIQDADRLIGWQLTDALNKRKLVALPYHCLQLGSSKDDFLRRAYLFNFQFLSCQLQSLGYTVFIDLFRQCLRLRPNWPDLRRLFHAVWSIENDFDNELNDSSLILAEQILGCIDHQPFYELYETNQKNSEELETLLNDCRQYCRQTDHSLEPVYAGFPQENAALAWTFQAISDVLYTSEYYAIVTIKGERLEENTNFINTNTVAVINIQTGKMDKINLDEKNREVWGGYVTKNGEKVYIFSEKAVQVFGSRNGEMMSERSLSWDSKSYCNKSNCISSDEEKLLIANEWRIIAFDEIDEGAICRSGRIPTRNPLFSVENSVNVKVHIRFFGPNEKFAVCLIFDELNRVLLTTWSLTVHEEILPMNAGLILQEFSSPLMFDIRGSFNETLYLMTNTGNLRVVDLPKLKTNGKVLAFSSEETIQQFSLLPGEYIMSLSCSSTDLIVVSTVRTLFLFERQNPKNLLQKIPFETEIFSWKILNQDEGNRVLLTVDETRKTVYLFRQDKGNQFPTNPIKIEFRSMIKSINLLESTPMMENDDKKKIFALMLLEDRSFQYLDTSQMSENALQPEGLFSKIQNSFIGSKVLIGSEFDEKSPLVLEINENQTNPVKIHRPLDSMNVEFAATIENEQFYLIVTKDRILKIYSANQFSQLFFEYDLSTKISSCYSMLVYEPGFILLLEPQRFLLLNIVFHPLNSSFALQSEHIVKIPQRIHRYSLEMTKNRKFLILSQNLQINEDETDLSDIRLYTLDKMFNISPAPETIEYIQAKTSRRAKMTGFRCYLTLENGSLLWVAHQGNILQARLPSKSAELQTRPDYHCWTRHALALYQKTTQKQNLTVTITSLAVKSDDETCAASGASDGSIILWFFINPYTHAVLDSIHSDEISSLQFETTTNRLFSSSLDQTLAIWSSSQILHVLHMHMPIENMKILSSENFLVVAGKFWAFERFLVFYIGNYSKRTAALKRKNQHDPTRTNTTQASDVLSWSL